MATVVNGSSVIVGSDGFHNLQVEITRNTPRIFEFVYMINDNQAKLVLAAESEVDAERLFYEIVGTDAQPVIESRGSSGVLHFVSPGLLDYYKNKLGQDLIARHAAYKAQMVAKSARVKALEDLKTASKRAKYQEQKADHAIDYLQQAIKYVKDLNVFKKEKEVVQEKDFKEWMKEKDK